MPWVVSPAGSIKESDTLHTCGALNWTLSQIPEPHHAICRTCHHDAAGLHWPTNPYATYDTSPLK